MPLLVPALVGVALCVVAAAVAALISGGVVGPEGARTGAVAGAVGLVFPALTACLIMLLRRREGMAAYAALAFAGFLALFLVKIAAFATGLSVVLAAGWTHAATAYGTLAALGIASLAIDLIVVNGIRVDPDSR